MEGILSPQLASNALTTLETVKEMMGIPTEESDPQVDNVLIRLINAASAWVETMTERKLGKNDYRQKCRGTGSQELVLKYYPIVSVQSVTEIGSGKVLPPESYDFDEKGDIGVLYREEGWPYRGYPGGLSGDYLAPQRYSLVEYTAGYVLPKDATADSPCTLPADLESLVWEMVEQEYQLRINGAQGLAAFSISDVSWTFDKTQKDSWISTINRYRRI